ncbi:MAG: hypothetical protein WBB37_02410 [bacterium]
MYRLTDIVKMKHCLIMLLIMLSYCQKQLPIDFFKENVVIEINGSGVEVTGQYFFKNLTNQDKRVIFYYPFPVDENHQYPESIILDYPYTKDTAGIYFSIAIKAQRIDSFEICYHQRTRKNQFTYITTTTKQWNRPIKNARFTIIIPDSLQVRFNYSPYIHEKTNHNDIFSLNIVNFNPNDDLEIEWYVDP